MVSPEFISVNTDLAPFPHVSSALKISMPLSGYSFTLYSKIFFLDQPQERVAISQVWEIGSSFDFVVFTVRACALNT